ncbi:MAG: FitA-like ribbon-helix-helix domain-containing protein [Rhodothermales bacterium]
MSTIYIRDVPERVHTLLKAQATRNRRSLSGEALILLEKALEEDLPDPAAKLAELRALHGRVPAVEVTPEEMTRIKRAGLP